MHPAPQFAFPEGQQSPLEQLVPASQLFPQPPQLLASTRGSTQLPPHVARAQAHVPASQACSAPHAQLSAPPQPSESGPHCGPTPAQVFGVHPQVPTVPPPPHVCGSRHPPQLWTERLRPQLSETLVKGSHCRPRRRQRAGSDSGVQPHRWAMPEPPQVAGAPHPPHWSVTPQPSLMVPHSAPSAAQFVGWQGGAPASATQPAFWSEQADGSLS